MATTIFYQIHRSQVVTFVLFVALIAALFGCADESSENTEAQHHHVRGIYLGSQFDGRVAVIHHETIPGLMEAMKMGFKLQDPQEIAALSGGEPISFNLLVRGEEWEIGQIAHLPDSTILDLPSSDAMGLGHQH